MDKQSYIVEVKNLLDQFLDNALIVQNNIIQYNCIICGRSKSNKPHMRVDYNNGFYHCFRCNEGAILYHLIKEFKNNNNIEYINALLKLYFQFYEYNSIEKKIKSRNNYNSYDFTIQNINAAIIEPSFDDIQQSFFRKRFPSIDDTKIFEIVKRFKINTTREHKLFYNSFYRKFAYAYFINNDLTHKKNKFANDNIINDKKDYYYLINSYGHKNLYISEGLFDLMTVYITNPLYNNNDSNYLALCCKNYKFLYEILLNSGKFFYDNIYLILDNDINEKKFIDGCISTLSNHTSSKKFKLYKNLYTITVPFKFIDLNDYYLADNSLPDLLINKVK